MQGSQFPWKEIRAVSSEACADWLRLRVGSSGLLRLRPWEVSGAVSCTEPQALAALDLLAAHGFLSVLQIRVCPNCLEEPDGDELRSIGETDLCGRCGSVVRGLACLLPVSVYTKQGQRGRDVPWVLVVHGMNTRAGWQEQLAWLMATSYGRSVPVYSYKYGLVRLGVLIGFRRRHMLADLTQRVQILSQGVESTTLGATPDVVAHSFGTWLVGHLLSAELLRAGRVILLGSILRPDFDWAAPLSDGRVDGVLNLMGGRDRWVPLSQFAIPDSGASGTAGFGCADARINNVACDATTHTSFFAPRELQARFAAVWGPFLTAPSAVIAQGTTAARPWRATSGGVQRTVATAIIGLAAALVGFTVLLLALGGSTLVRWLSS